jgi:peptidoglycan/LPS O-acetylase OafA/YrhL
MSLSEDHIRRAVDEVLEPAWPVEARRATRAWNLATLARAAVGIVGFGLLLTVISLIEGRSFPWTFLVFIAVLTVVLACHAARDPEHLRRE